MYSKKIKALEARVSNLESYIEQLIEYKQKEMRKSGTTYWARKNQSGEAVPSGSLSEQPTSES